jgi:glc operon protein GlcG
MYRSIAFQAFLFALASPLCGQVAERKTLTLEGARAVIVAAVAEAKKNAGTGVIAVVDDGGNLMALERLDSTFPAGANISIGKARTAALFKKPTRAFEEIIGKGRTSMVALSDFTPLQGGVPITVEGQVVGGVGVSGAASAAEDEKLALAGAAAVDTACCKSLASPAPVNYFEKEKVASAFAQGSVLFAGDRYMVHASNRKTPGQAEVHLKDADIIYVLQGEATLVTGGTVVEGKPSAADEVRGSEIQGGETRRISEGDVVIVPAGTPHWFKEVPGEVLYFVVKVR